MPNSKNTDELGQYPLSATEAIVAEFLRIYSDRLPRSPRDEADLWKMVGDLDEAQAPKALCLSGGGIRSATFCLGVMQGLATNGKIGQFDYLSTVSGGGYIGSWLSRCSVDGQTLEAALRETPDIGPSPDHPVRRLRSFSNYLSPSWGFSLDTLTVATIFLRNLLFNLLFWIPLLLLLAMLPRAVVALLRSVTGGSGVNWLGMSLGDVEAATLIVPGMTGLIWISIALAVLITKWRGEEWRESLSRVAAAPLLVGVPWLILFFLFIDLPPIILREFSSIVDSPARASASGGIFAMLTALFGFWGRYGTNLRKKAYGFAAKIGARLLDLIAVITLIIVSFGASMAVHVWFRGYPDTSSALSSSSSLSEAYRFYDLVERTGGTHFWNALAFLACLLIIVSFFVGANRYSLHALYGNRIVRAYLGSARQQRQPSPFTDFDPQDNIAMAALPGGENYQGSAAMRPYHVVNMTLNLTRRAGQRRDWQERKGASFTATPLHCGSEGVGYADSRYYGGNWGMTLGRAMTISGAAATPNMGYHSSPLVALVMTFFNVRLGWWVPHPKNPTVQREPRFGLRYLLKEALSGTNDKSKWLYLSDGGHFENLGLYEMVRRRSRCVVVVDATCDGDFKYSDLHNAVRKVGVDLSVPIDLPTLLPGQAGAPQGHRVAVGTIRYTALGDKYPDGKLFVVKPLLIGDEPPSLGHYAEISRRSGKTFPHHSTADQFFNETQFESYRHLGELTALELVRVMAGGAPYAPIQPVNAPVALQQPGPPATPPPAQLAGLEGMRLGLQALGPGQLIAGTIAAVGAIGVATGVGETITHRVIEVVVGTPYYAGPNAVALKLADEDRKRLDNGLIVKADAEALTVLRGMIARLEVLMAHWPPSAAEPGLTKEIRTLQNWLVIYAQRQPRSIVANFDQKNLVKILTQLERLQAGSGGQNTASEANLAEVVRQLKVIALRVESTSPRRNVRGQ